MQLTGINHNVGACNCGLPFPTTDLEIARKADFFRFGNGRMLHGIYFINVMFSAKGIYSFQFLQVSKELIYLRYIPDKTDRMMPGIFLAFMLGLIISSTTGGSLLPSGSGIPFSVQLYVLLGIWVSYYRTQMLELNAM